MASSKFDPQAPDRSDTGTGDGYAATKPTAALDDEIDLENVENLDEENLNPLPGVDWLQLIGRADQMSREYQSRTIERPLSRSYRAWNNQHAEGSKYLGPAWRGRSRLFVPKTRSAVRKNLATAAAALFSTDGVVNLSAQFEDDPIQRATAASIQADLDYRMTRTGAKTGIPWFQIAMGACLDAQLTAVSISKQYWDYQEVTKNQRVTRPVIDEVTGEPMVDLLTGEPIMETVIEAQTRVTRDRPMSDIHPIENAGFDPAAPWHSPVQLGRWFIMHHPMGLDDAKAMIKSASKNEVDNGWLDVDEATLLKGRRQEERSGARRTREGGGDRYEDGKTAGELDIIWLQENFIRIDGQDYHFWSVGRHAKISKVRPTEEAYPAFDGERPYVMGMSSLDTHRIFPMSPVESWQPLQIELNDVTNLRQDTLKRSIAPIAVVKRGKNVDLAQVQRRGQPDTTLLVDSMDDVAFTSTPGPSGASYTETSVNNAMFDELAGVFSTSSVQANRQLNETVGGMRLMSGAANSVSEFDLRMWVETWVEPVIRQFAHLVKYYETDERMLALSNSAAKTEQKFEGALPTFSDYDQVELFVRVNVGIGASDPMQKLGKLRAAFEMLGPIMPLLEKQGIKLKAEAIVEEVMGAAGFRDGMRFFEIGQAPQQEQNPELMKFMEEMKIENAKVQVARDKVTNELQAAILEMREETQRNKLDNQTRVAVAQIQSKTALTKDLVGVHAGRERQAADVGERRRDQALGIVKDFAGRKADAKASKGSEDLAEAVRGLEERETQIIAALKMLSERVVGGTSAQQPQGTMIQ